MIKGPGTECYRRKVKESLIDSFSVILAYARIQWFQCAGYWPVPV
jgi:hypothetical protein